MAQRHAWPCHVITWKISSDATVVIRTEFKTATGTAEVGGWTTRELLSVLDGLEGLEVVGADVGES